MRDSNGITCLSDKDQAEVLKNWPRHPAGSKDSARQWRLSMGGRPPRGGMCANLLHGVQIEGCVDKNPFKQGKFVPGTGYPVISPADITFPTVRAVLVENDVYLEEIQLEVMKLDPRVQVYSLHLALHIGTDTVDLFP